MSQRLPLRDFKFLSEIEVIAFPLTLSTLTEHDNLGYILEVDLEYPKHLHDMHNDYPLAPEHYKVPKDHLSTYAKEFLTKFGEKTEKDGDEKLIPTLYDRQKYVVHYLNILCYLEQGIVLTRIYRVLQFVQETWLKPYIAFNTENKKRAANTSKKNLWKLCNNAIFEKALESLRRRQDVRIVANRMQAKHLIARPTVDRFRIISENLTIVKMARIRVYWNRPKYAGMCILELSKLHMYKFHYDYIHKQYGYEAKLLYTNTDSLTYELSTDDAYADMGAHLSLYDTSDFPLGIEGHNLQRSGNAKVLGKFKDE